MKNREIADVFEKMARLLEFKGDVVFKIRAYARAAETLRNLTESIEDVAAEKRLHEIPGIGATLCKKIEEFIADGRLVAYFKLIEEVPESVLDVMSVPGVGPKKARLFYDRLKIKDLDDLDEAIKSEKLLDVPGIKQKSFLKIKKAFKAVRQGRARLNLGQALAVEEKLRAFLDTLSGIRQVEFAGSLRRGQETIGDIDILIDAEDHQAILDQFVKYDDVKDVLAHGSTKVSVLLSSGLQVDMRVVESDVFGSALLYFTGSKSFNIKIRQWAKQQSKKVSEYGVFSEVDDDASKRLASATEEECFAALGLPNVPPELREELGEARIFQNDIGLPNLVQASDIKGEFHVHSTWSDGKHSIREMLEAAKTRGYKFLAISDHSHKLRVASGLSPEELFAKMDEVQALNKEYDDFNLLCGAEVEIDKDGHLDYDEEILNELDVVVAAVHSHFDQTPEQMTKRLLRAIANPHVHILAHPTGVHIGKRLPYEFDFDAICQAAIEHHVCLEINGSSVRLDLNTAHIDRARQRGAMFVLNSDAHATQQLRFMNQAVKLARRGWLTADHILNAKPWAEIKAFLQQKKSM